MADTDKLFDLEIITPQGIFKHLSCDSVHLNLSDDRKEQKGGNIGIRKGHASAVFLLAEGKTTALLNGEVVFSASTGEGFAIMEKNLLSVIVESCG